MFKIIDTDGWEEPEPIPNFLKALTQLKRIRQSGRKRAIITDVGVVKPVMNRKVQTNQRERSAYKVRADLTKNRLYISLGEMPNRATIKKGVKTVERMCRSLTPGFTCLVDLRHYKPMDQNDEKFIRQVQKILLETGIRKIVRVGGKKSILGLFRGDQKSILFSTYTAQTTSSIQQAERILDEVSSGAQP